MDEKGNLELLNTIETMEDILDSAMRIPLSNGRCVIDAERFQELLSDMRLNLPTELKQAKNLLITEKISFILLKKRRKIPSISRKNAPKKFWIRARS